MIERETRDGAVADKTGNSLPTLSLSPDSLGRFRLFFSFSLPTEKKTCLFLSSSFAFYLLLPVLPRPLFVRKSDGFSTTTTTTLCCSSLPSSKWSKPREQRSSRIRIPCLLQLKNRELEDAGCYVSLLSVFCVKRHKYEAFLFFFFFSHLAISSTNISISVKGGKSRQIQARTWLFPIEASREKGKRQHLPIFMRTYAQYICALVYSKTFRIAKTRAPSQNGLYYSSSIPASQRNSVRSSYVLDVVNKNAGRSLSAPPFQR